MSSLLDDEHLSELRFVLGDDFPAFIHAFIDDTDRKLEQLQALLSDASFQATKDLAHSLKGSCLNLGAKTMAQLCQKLNAATEPADHQAQLHLLQLQWEATRKELSEQIG